MTTDSGELALPVEAAMLGTFKLRADFIGVLSFVEPDLFVLVRLADPDASAPDFEKMSLSDLSSSPGVSPQIVSIFRAASERSLAQRFADEVDSAIDSALDRASACLLNAFAVDDGQVGWSVDLNVDLVGVLSSAQAILALIHAGRRDYRIEQATTCLEQAQNRDGGWQVKYSLTGKPNGLSITESTCFSLWALLEAGRPVDGSAIAGGAGWLLSTQGLSGGWPTSNLTRESRVIPTALAVQVLARLGFHQAAAQGVKWLRAAQTVSGGWGYLPANGTPEGEPDVAPTAHAVISLLTATVPQDDKAVLRACAYLRETFHRATDAMPWQSSIATPAVDTRSTLPYRHFATPWAVSALLLAGADLSEPLVQSALSRLLQAQQADGVWREPTFANEPHLWAVHDAVYALKNAKSLASLGQAAVRHHHRQAEAATKTALCWLTRTRDFDTRHRERQSP
ncbi:prenyltransferase/squalene oxidase repeat-containing protein [Kibdelosporangium aridum]|uniref:prenyltransferase/squalene oxidase repeat-containing protein n=1 Tax=Kibdelosporangium aridum TaxID=2030 RepID=UPI00163BC980|nr:prenyltransferase/squalene oxidase repeat-containing protein [Kibdelosporangium aridum]